MKEEEVKLTRKNSVIMPLLITAAVITSFIAIDDYTRRDGIPKNQKMTLTKKEIMKRKVDPTSNDYGEGYLPAEEYARLSFDTDGNTNTTEVTAIPGHNWWKGIEEVKSFQLGEEKTLKDWKIDLEKNGHQRQKDMPFSEEYDRTPLYWQWEKVR